MPQVKRRHKAYVVTDDETWIAFRAVCMVRGATIEYALGALVERLVASPAPMEPRKVIADSATAATAAAATSTPARSSSTSSSRSKTPAPSSRSTRGTSKRSEKPVEGRSAAIAGSKASASTRPSTKPTRGRKP